MWRPLRATMAAQQARLVYRYVERRPRCVLRDVCLGTGLSKGNAARIVRTLVGAAQLVELADDDGAPAMLVVVKGRAPF